MARTPRQRASAALGHAGAMATRIARGTRRRLPGRPSRALLPNLVDLHPEARSAPRREIGLVTIPVAEIRGTAVEGPAQRTADFKPLPELRGDNWRARYQRLRNAQDALLVLPPIDVVEAAGGYWVVDGHNRVALALDTGQDDIDASVTHVHLAGGPEIDRPTSDLTTVLDDSAQVRAAIRPRVSPEPRPPRTDPAPPR